MKLNPSNMFGGLRDSLGRARLSLLEIIALAAALAFIGVVTFYYFTKVQPLQSQLDALAERERVAKEKIEKLNSDEQKRQQQASNAETILASLTAFEIYLKPDERGMTEIINEIDSLGKKHKVLAGDSTYRVAEADQPPGQQLGENGQPKQKANEDKQTIYPALGIDTNVIGEYPNLRRFLGDLEQSRQFLIINSLAFQGESDKVKREAQKAGKQKLETSSPDAALVSLKVEMDTYFKSPYKKETNKQTGSASETPANKPLEKAANQKMQ
ncbi:MAG TPA: GspMb/PilO family protein [Blastocatellia bacterium]|nr:GspMb/PilO family protein [Blastocatellia bacterium]HMV83727.1 GspMb/PilO family protein [Blastocatellia bacterium]HMX25255.1 GspMb/PilO family protein [Blastocatellia bacterium]HMY72439.1 GspMb/PilO family protein [Blastocatellia bacterium]HMZ21836.1 GspMb/PilO family protein [Blastocatellia bacterium]